MFEYYCKYCHRKNNVIDKEGIFECPCGNSEVEIRTVNFKELTIDQVIRRLCKDTNKEFIDIDINRIIKLNNRKQLIYKETRNPVLINSEKRYMEIMEKWESVSRSKAIDGWINGKDIKIIYNDGETIINGVDDEFADESGDPIVSTKMQGDWYIKINIIK